MTRNPSPRDPPGDEPPPGRWLRSAAGSPTVRRASDRDAIATARPSSRASSRRARAPRGARSRSRCSRSRCAASPSGSARRAAAPRARRRAAHARRRRRRAARAFRVAPRALAVVVWRFRPDPTDEDTGFLFRGDVRSLVCQSTQQRPNNPNVKMDGIPSWENAHGGG